MNSEHSVEVGVEANASSPWGTRKQRASQRAIKRAALMKKAAYLFRRHGFAGASLEEVAQALGVTKPTLYYYVGNKAELVHACAMEGLTQAIAAVRQYANEGLAAALHTYAKVVGSDFGWCMVRVAEFALPVPMKNTLQHQRKALEQTFQSLVPQAEVISVLLRALEGVVLHTPKVHWASAVQLLCAGLQPAAHSQTVILATRPRQRMQTAEPVPVSVDPEVVTEGEVLTDSSAAPEPVRNSTPSRPDVQPVTAQAMPVEQALPVVEIATEPERASVPSVEIEKDVSAPLPTEVQHSVQIAPASVAGTAVSAAKSSVARKKAAAKIEQISLF